MRAACGAARACSFVVVSKALACGESRIDGIPFQRCFSVGQSKRAKSDRQHKPLQQHLESLAALLLLAMSAQLMHGSSAACQVSQAARAQAFGLSKPRTGSGWLASQQQVGDGRQWYPHSAARDVIADRAVVLFNGTVFLSDVLRVVLANG